jgi:rod shape-determining protein MreC
LAKKSFDKVRPFFILAIFLLVWKFIPKTIWATLQTSFYEFQAPAWIASSKAADLHSYWSLRTNSERELIQQGIELQRKVSALELELEKEKLKHEEIESLKSLVSLPDIPGYKYETARVCKRDLTSWWQEITIRKGKNYNIQENSPVVFAGGIVGKVIKVHATTSVVQLITSRHFRMAARFQDVPRPVTFTGSINSSFQDPVGMVKDAPSDVYVTEDAPQTIISSDLGSIFPGGLKIGTVTYLEPGTNGLFKTGIVKLDPRLLYLKEVSVIVSEDSNNDPE